MTMKNRPAQDRKAKGLRVGIEPVTLSFGSVAKFEPKVVVEVIPRAFVSQSKAMAFAKGVAGLVTFGITASSQTKRLSVGEALARDWSNVGRDLSTAFRKVKSSGTP